MAPTPSDIPARPRPIPLAKQAIAVVGASSGIGRATAAAFLDAGAAVAAMARRGELLRELVTERRPGADRTWTFSGDATVREDVQSFVDGAAERFGRLDVLVANTGLNIRGRAFGELTAESWERILAANLTAAFHCTQAVLPQLRRQGGGLIIYISSASVLGADASGAAYQAAKHGLSGLVGAVRFEERDRHIRTSIVFPGAVNTPLILQRPVPPTAEQLAVALQPEDVAAACLFVAGMPPHVAIPELVMRPALL